MVQVVSKVCCTGRGVRACGRVGMWACDVENLGVTENFFFSKAGQRARGLDPQSFATRDVCKEDSVRRYVSQCPPRWAPSGSEEV